MARSALYKILVTLHYIMSTMSLESLNKTLVHHVQCAHTLCRISFDVAQVSFSS